jgi:hypothetical protein
MTVFGSEHLAVYLCSHVFNQERPVLLVSHAGNDWQFLCGDTHPESEVPVIVGVMHLVARDPTLEQVADLPPGGEAERASIDHAWVRYP